MCAALPVTSVCREAEVLPQSGVSDVSPEIKSKHAMGARKASAQICVTIVFDPWPISTAPWCSATLPSRFSPMRTVEGFGSDVFPHPYHIPATPTPRRIGRSEEHTSELQSRLHLVCRRLL